MIRQFLFLLSLTASLAFIGCASDDGGGSTTGDNFNTVDTSNPSDMPTEAMVDTSVNSYNETSTDTSGLATRTYTVQSGDSLWKIAKENNTSAGTIKALNNLTSNTIQVGQTLKLPAQ